MEQERRACSYQYPFDKSARRSRELSTDYTTCAIEAEEMIQFNINGQYM